MAEPTPHQTPHDAAAPLPPEVARALADPARRVGRHALLRELGRGGMGVVYEAFDTSLRRPVALKLLTGAADPAARARFAREARAAARLRHPGIVAVHDVGEQPPPPPSAAGRDAPHGPYLVMDLVAGRSLADRLGEGPLPAREAARVLRAVALALAEAHREGVIHRDVKPQNILLDERDRPRLTDFGIAREVTDTDGLTRTGVFLGTPGYAPPEQVAGERDRVGPRSDVYAAGAVLYHCLAGRPPFWGDSTLDVAVATMREEPASPRRLDTSVHRDLDTIVLCCLEKDPARRYASAGELAADLGRFLAGEPILARPASAAGRAARWARRHPVGATAVAAASAVVVAAVSFGGVLLARTRRDARAAERGALVERVRETAADAWRAFEVAPEDDARLALGLLALRAADRWLGIDPGDEQAAAAVFRSAMALGRAAVAAEQWGLARSAFGEACDLGVDDADARAAVSRVELAREAAARDRRVAVAAILEDARSGVLAAQPGGYEDALFALVALGEDPATVAQLVGTLDELTDRLEEAVRDAVRDAAAPTREEAIEGARRIDGALEALARLLAQGPERAPDAAVVLQRALDRLRARELRAGFRAPAVEGGLAVLGRAQGRALGEGGRTLLRLACEALGRIGREQGAVAALDRYLRVELDGARAAPAGIALCLIGGSAADQAALAAQLRFGRSSPFVARVRPYLARTGVDTPLDAETAGGHVRRGVARLDKDLVAEALEDFDAAVRLDPGLGIAWSNRGVCLRHMGRLEEALDSCERAVALAPHDPVCLFNRAISCLALGQLRRAEDDLRRAIEVDGTHGPSWVRLGMLLRDTGRVEEALDTLRAATRIDPHDGRGWLALANTLSGHVGLAPALEAYDRAIAVDPTDASAWQLKGLARGNHGDLEGSVADLTRAIELEPDQTDHWNHRAKALYQLGRVDAALEDLDRAIALHPENASAYGLRGIARRVRGDQAGALDDLTHAVTLDPTLASAWTNRSLVRREADDLEGAVADATRAIELDPSLAEPLITRANAHRARGDDASAERDLRRAIEVAPDQMWGWNNLGALLKDRGELEEAIACYDRALAIQPDFAHGYGNRAGAKVRAGDVEGGLADYTRAIELEPRSAIAWYNRGVTLQDRGDRAGARRDLDRAIELDPGFVRAWRNRGWLSRQEEDLDGALRDQTRAIELAPDDARHWYERGGTRKVRGDVDGAIADYTRAIELDPRHHHALLGRGAAHHERGDGRAAIADLERYLELAPPSDPRRITARNMLKELGVER